jgi:hypothetical protein
MKSKNQLLKWVLILLFSTHSIVNAQKITDTIFYNKLWWICEKPVAAYYRIGTLSVDSAWFYTGKFKDFTIKGQLVAEGEYNEKGQKDGLFRFYFPAGRLMASGKFWQDYMIGNWQWYYDNDSTMAIINFDGPTNDFKFVRYRSRNGKTVLENGSGDFEWYPELYNIELPVLKVYGSFSSGKRSGSWRYYIVKPGGEFLHFTEKYDDDGKFKKATKSATYRGDVPKDRYLRYRFIPSQVDITEAMFFDNFFSAGDSSGRVAVLNYLLNRKSSEIIVKNKDIENALSYIIRTLEHNRGSVEHQQKEVDAKMEFKIGEKGYPEDLTITGTGITDKEKEYLTFLVSKFSKIEMPGTESVVIERYYRINLFSVNMKEYVPAFIRSQVNNELFFTTLPKENFLLLLKTLKKGLKKFIREEVQFYW